MKKRAVALIALFLFSVIISVSASNYDTVQTKNTVSPLISKIKQPAKSPISDLKPKMKEIWLGICFESDYGRDYDHAGTTTYLPPASDWCRTQVSGMLEQCRDFRIGSCLQYLPDECRIASIPDRCLDGAVLIEAYCSWRGASTTYHRCRNGCYNGACY